MDERVTDIEKPGVPKGMPEQEGVPAPGMAQSDSADVEALRQSLEEARARLQELETTRERDVSQLRSSLDQRYGQEIAERERRIGEMEERMHAAAMANMDEAERTQYRLQIAEERNQRLREQLEQANMVTQQQSIMGQYARDFMQMGVPANDLDFSSPQAMWDSGWTGLKQIREAEREELERFRTNQPTDSPPQTETVAQTPRRTPVLTQHTPGGEQVKTLQSVAKSLEAQFGQPFDEDKVLTWVERRYVPPDILDGVDWTRS